MPFRVSGKNIDIGEALRTRVNQRIAEATAKYFDGGYSGHVTIGKDGFGFRTECLVHLDSGITLEAEAVAPDAYLSADQAAERIEKRLRRYKRRLKDHHRVRTRPVESVGAAAYILASGDASEESEPETLQPMIIAEMVTKVPSLSVGEAVMQMELQGAPVLVFRNEGQKSGVNVVYRRDDGNIGWIDPN